MAHIVRRNNVCRDIARLAIAVSAICLGVGSAAARVLINEIHYNPDVKTDLTEFVELYNDGDQWVNLEGWQLSGGISYKFPVGWGILPHGYLVVAQSPGVILNLYSINPAGPWEGMLRNSGDKITLKDPAGTTVHEVSYQLGFPWPTVGDAPTRSIQLVNPAFDATLGGNWRAATPTPGIANTEVWSTNLPPLMRQVDHSPNQPASGQPVTVTVKVTDLDGVAGVTLEYQKVEPGAYIELTDPEYATSWTAIPMNDSGTNGDLRAGDSIYTAVIPGSLQTHRALIRYRITATDKTGLSMTAPYADDPQPNFAYFCYDGIPAWQGSVRPGYSNVVTFETNVMRQLPAIHLIAKNSSVTNATWGNYAGSEYLWAGTLVFNGKVYDHIHYRPRGGEWRFAMVKNMWKFEFNRGHDLEMVDDYGRKYSAEWKKLNLGACIQQGNYGHRGEQGMFESMGFRLFNSVGVPAPRTTFLQLRVIDDALESDPTTQYEGDFWGLYLGVEQPDARFIDEHNLPDGNLYKMEGGTGTLNNTGLYGPTDRSDLNTFTHYGSTEAWWRSNLDVNEYYSYRTIVDGVHQYDIGAGKNYFYFHNPTNGLWSVMPWDMDLTWADNMYGDGNEPFRPVLNLDTCKLEYQNRVREIRDLLFNTNQAWQMIDEHARLLRGANAGPTFLDADRAMWDYNPRMTTNAYKAGQGRFYQWPYESVSKDFDGCVTLMKNYVVSRARVLDSWAVDRPPYSTYIPSKPSITYAGPSGFPVNKLAFTSSAYTGTMAFAAMKWRIAEVTDTNAPIYTPADPVIYEITPVWEGPEVTNYSSDFTFPAQGIKPGHAYRARVRMKNSTGRWSNWSDPVQFIAGQPDMAGALTAYLRVTELMYNPPAGSDYEFVELHNTSTNLTLNLAGVAFTAGITYTFPAGATLAPGAYLLVIRNADSNAFRTHYGLDSSVSIYGPYSGSFANNGEQVTLKTSSGGQDIASFTYNNGYGWPQAAAGAGHSLVPVHPDAAGQDSGALDYPGNWRASSFLNGSPGQADPQRPAPAILLNEIAANTGSVSSDDWIELYNTTDSDITLNNWFLSDDPANPKKWAIPATTISARSRVVFDEVTGFHTNTNGFGLDKTGEQVLLSHMTGAASDRVVDEVSFKGQDNLTTLGRYPDGAPFWVVTEPTRGAANSARAPGLCITELMYHPQDLGTNDNTRDEFVKIYNPTANVIPLSDTNGVWRIAGGIDYLFPANTSIPPGGSICVVSFDPADTTTLNAFRAAYNLGSVNVRVFGPYSGKLSNRSNRVALERPKYPEASGEAYWWVTVDEVVYGNQDPWPVAANGTGQSLQRRANNQSGNDPANWICATPNPGSVVLDSDGDGIPDQWELANGLNPNDPYDAALDLDGDGLTNLQEYQCGTDPRDPASRLSFDSADYVQSGVRLRFTAKANRSYTVQTSDTLAPSSWTSLTNVTAIATEQTVEIIDPAASHARFYRLVTPAQP